MQKLKTTVKTKINLPRWVKYLIPLVLLVFVFLCSRIPALAEWYIQVFYPAIATVLSWMNRWVSFSLLDALMIVAMVLLLFTNLKDETSRKFIVAELLVG